MADETHGAPQDTGNPPKSPEQVHNSAHLRTKPGLALVDTSQGMRQPAKVARSPVPQRKLRGCTCVQGAGHGPDSGEPELLPPAEAPPREPGRPKCLVTQAGEREPRSSIAAFGFEGRRHRCLGFALKAR